MAITGQLNGNKEKLNNRTKFSERRGEVKLNGIVIAV